MGTTMSNDEHTPEHFEEIHENIEHEILNENANNNDECKTDNESKTISDDDESKTDNESKTISDDNKIYCVLLDGEPIFYIKDKTDDEIRSILKVYAKKICQRAQRHYSDLLFYIEEDDNLGIEITTVHKFVLLRYETTYCTLRCKPLTLIN